MPTTNTHKFFIKGEETNYVQGFTFEHSLEHPVANFTLKCSNDAKGIAYPADRFVIADIYGSSYFNGIILAMQEQRSRDVATIAYQGKNISGLVRRDDPIPKEYKSKSVKTIILDALKDSNAGSLYAGYVFDEKVASSVIPKIKPEFNEAEDVLNFVARVARAKGLYVFETPDGYLHFEKPKNDGPVVKAFDFDLAPDYGGLDCDISRSVNITDSATDFSFQMEKKTTVDKIDRTNEKYEFVAYDTSTAAAKYSQFYNHGIIDYFFKDRNYAVLGTNRKAPGENGNFRQKRFVKITNDDMTSLDEQKEKIIRDNMPKFTIELRFDHVELGQLNNLYIIRNSNLDIDGKFLLSGYKIEKTEMDNGFTTMIFTLPGFLS